MNIYSEPEVNTKITTKGEGTQRGGVTWGRDCSNFEKDLLKLWSHLTLLKKKKTKILNKGTI